MPLEFVSALRTCDIWCFYLGKSINIIHLTSLSAQRLSFVRCWKLYYRAEDLVSSFFIYYRFHRLDDDNNEEISSSISTSIMDYAYWLLIFSYTSFTLVLCVLGTTKLHFAKIAEKNHRHSVHNRFIDLSIFLRLC